MIEIISQQRGQDKLKWSLTVTLSIDTYVNTHSWLKDE